MTKNDTRPILSHQPLRAGFKLLYIGSVSVRVPWWLTRSLIPSLRPHPTWTFKQAFMTRLIYAAIDMEARIGITKISPLDKRTVESPDFQVIEPYAPDFYKGEIAGGHNANPTAVGGTWYARFPEKDITSGTVVLYLHGGAFVKGDSRQSYSGFMSRTLLEHGKADAVFSVEYRLSDALTSYLYLSKTLQIPTDHIVLVGDSAGGNLAIALLRYIQEHGVELELSPPSSCVLFSPWVAPFEDVKKSPNFRGDWLPPSALRWGAHAYGASLPNPATHRFVTPLGNPFKAGTPIFVSYGEFEVFDQNIMQWAHEMKDMNHIEMNREVDAPHDTSLVGEFLGFQQSAKELAVKVGKFIVNNK
ncbi:alpha/beta hydrolase fold-3 domain-containing protein [Xylariaceae sp. FL1272]|nr:alpha/beta hydrolase fold-3 domain-containing protein [Xylariaceae sp. FL1272]